MSMDDIFGEPIFTYSRAQALEDGVLKDVTDGAAAMGFKVPVAIAINCWNENVAWPSEEPMERLGYETAREYILLHEAMRHMLATRDKPVSGDLEFEVPALRYPDQEIELNRVFVNVGPGDEGEVVVTIMASQDL